MKLNSAHYREIFGDYMELVSIVPAREKKSGGQKKPRHFLKGNGLAVAINGGALLEKIRKLGGEVSEKVAIPEKTISEKKPEKVSEKVAIPAKKEPEKISENVAKVPENKINQEPKWWEDL